MRKIKVIKEIPILVLSAYNEDALINEALEAGADDYINKTILPNDLSEIIDKCLEVGAAVLTKRASRIKTQESEEKDN